MKLVLGSFVDEPGGSSSSFEGLISLFFKKYLQSSLPASSYTKKEEGARCIHSVLYSLSSFT